jgi:Plavaka transposase
MTGGRVAHPLLISLANLFMDFRNKGTNHAFYLLALLPVPKFIHKNRKICGILESRLVHECLDFILKPLKKAAEIGIMMSDPLGSLRYAYTPLAACIVDTPEAAMLSGVAGKTSHVTTASYKEFGDPFRHRPRTSSMTLAQLQAIEDNVAPWDINAYAKKAATYRLNGVHRLFWRDWPLSDPSKFLTPEPLHHWHKMFWDHDAKWCIRAVGPSEIDFRFSILHPHTGFRQFQEGISKLKQVTGREHRDMQRYMVAVIADAVPKDFLVAIRALADFRYLSQAPEISDQTCTMIDDALQEFHNHKDSIISAGVRTGKGGRVINNWHIPKLEFMQSVTASIRDNGAPMQWSADHTERCHITEVKDPSRSGNRQDYESQICRYLDRIEKCRLFNLATSIRDTEVNVTSLWSDADVVENKDNDDDDEGLIREDLQPSTHSEKSRPTRHANYFELAHSLQRGIYPTTPLPYRTIVRGHTALHVSRDPMMRLSVDEAMKKFNLPDLRCALADFLVQSNYEDSIVIGGRRMAAVDTQLPFDELQIWIKVQLQNHSYYAPYNILPSQTVNASPPSGTWTSGRSDIILFNIDPSKIWPQSGIEGVFMEASESFIKYAINLLQVIMLPNYA